MKTAKTIIKDNKKIVIGFSDAQIDPVETLKAIERAGHKITEENRKKLIETYAIYFQNKDEKLTDQKYSELKAKKSQAQVRQVVTLDGDILDDYIGETEIIKKDGKFVEQIIDKLGVKPKKLSETEETEYREQRETERISKLNTAEKTAEKENKLDALALEAKHKKDIAEIRGKTFDAVKYFNDNKSAVEDLYG
jgi:DNA polymerase II small subunit/DNA polymerase delta subunit B